MNNLKQSFGLWSHCYKYGVTVTNIKSKIIWTWHAMISRCTSYSVLVAFDFHQYINISGILFPQIASRKIIYKKIPIHEKINFKVHI
jgi:hypothetical protein